MPMLSSGLVIAGAYADKIRRTLFAQMRDYVRYDKTWAQRIAYAVAQLNRFLYTILVEQLKINKGDVIRVRIEYEIDEDAKEIKWKWETLQLEVFRRIPQDQVDALVKQFITRAAEVSTAAVAYGLKRLGETFDGDVVYAVTLDDKEVGAVVITPVNQSLAILKVCAVVEPTPAIFEKARLEIAPGQDLESVLKNALSTVMQVAKHVSYDEALKMVNAIRSKVAAKPMEAIEVEEEES